MKTEDLIQVVYSTEVLTNCEQNLSGMEEFANLHARDLSAEDRVSYGSINETNKLLVNKGQIIMEQNPELIPQFVDFEEFGRDFIAREQIEKVLLRLEVIKQKLTNTKILLDHDNYHDVLAFYRSVRYLAKEQVQGAIPIYDELKQYFPHTKSKKSVQE